MKYALRITRDLGTNAVTVHPVSVVRNTVKPYRIVYRHDSPQHYAESLRLFGTREEAENAFRDEQTAAEFSSKTPMELTSILKVDLDALKRDGYPLTLVCKLAGVPYDSVRSYLDRFNPPNPRTVAKVHILLPAIRIFQEHLQKTLPLREGCGHPNRARPYPRAKKYR